MDVVRQKSREELSPKTPWLQVRSPEQVLAKCLAALGWIAPDARRWTTEEGLQIDLLRLAPRQVLYLAEVAARKASDTAATKAADKRGWAGPVAWAPLLKLKARGSAALLPREKAALGALVGNSVWSSARLFQKGRALTPRCLACGHEQGTLWHSRFECVATEGLRRQHASKELRECAEAAASFSTAVGESFARGVFPEPTALVNSRQDRVNGKIEWVNKPAGGRLSGLLFTDGSCKYPAWPALRTAGWSIVSVTVDGDLVAAVFGDVPAQDAPRQSSRDGEDYAVRMLAFFADFPMVVHVDCAGTVGSARCKTKSTGAKATNAHLWGHFHAELGDGQVEFKKTKGHATQRDLDIGISTHWEREANGHADRLAKKGADFGLPEPDQLNAYFAMMDIARQAAWYTAKVQAARADIEKQLQEEDLAQPCFRDGPEFLSPGAHAAVAANAVGTDAVEEVDGYPISACPPCRVEGCELEGAVVNGHLVVSAEVLGNVGCEAGGGRDSTPAALLYCAICGAFVVEKGKLLRRQCGGKDAQGLTIQRA